MRFFDFSSAGDSFQIFTANGFSGAFSDIPAFDPGDGLDWDFSQVSSTGTISVILEPKTLILADILDGVWLMTGAKYFNFTGRK
ncbi:MAG: hypothetical protein JJU29_09035 [Verrucomicrobia bacterium]|nr:hypothetical protein [Verrucomicrobiota bacterium]MCH8511796.1 hypothetical protein [Kiritimatiellia bacterium]